ncbi:hypothetical protein FRC00_007770 [Tulasnella sp. 408]|nr:hypothetical protein FRC00_007770 [Tulasnella sp. 408]
MALSNGVYELAFSLPAFLSTFCLAEPPSSATRLPKRKREIADKLDGVAAETRRVSPSQPVEKAAQPDPSTRQQRRNRRRRASRKAKVPSVLSKRRALYRKAETIASKLASTSLPHSTQGYMGSTKSARAPSHLPSSPQACSSGSLPPGVDDMAHPRLLSLLRSGYRLVHSSGEAALFLDCDDRIIGWRTGIVGGKANEARWDAQNAELSIALEELARKLPRQTGTPSGVSRDSWKTWAPKVHRDYAECHHGILERQPLLDLVYPRDADEALPFASLTANLGPQTICKSHRDIKNKANGGVCTIKTLGPYNSKRGGHIVLHELGLIIEMRPGDVIFFPSAVITHETIPIGPDEKRYSLVWYSAAGLFRWRDADFRSLRSWEQQEPNGYSAHQKLGEERWTGGWKKFSTLADLVAQTKGSSLVR